MSQDDPDLEEQIDAQTLSGRKGGVLSLFAIVAAVVVYQATGNPLVAVAIPSSQAALKPLQCGIWLWLFDPTPMRGRVHFWFYLSLAFWMAAVSAFSSVVVFLLMDGLIGQPPPMNLFVPTSIVLLGGICFGSMAGVVGVVLALRNRATIWLHPNLREKCIGDFTRLTQVDLTWNFAIFVIMPSLIVLILLVTGVILVWNAGPIPILCFFLGPWPMVALSLAIAPRIVAGSPAECWG